MALPSLVISSWFYIPAWGSIPGSPVKNTHSVIFRGHCWIITLVYPWESSFEALVLTYMLVWEQLKAHYLCSQTMTLGKVSIDQKLCIYSNDFSGLMVTTIAPSLYSAQNSEWHCVKFYFKVMNIRIPDGVKVQHLASLNCSVFV